MGEGIKENRDDCDAIESSGHKIDKHERMNCYESHSISSLRVRSHHAILRFSKFFGEFFELNRLPFKDYIDIYLLHVVS